VSFIGHSFGAPKLGHVPNYVNDRKARPRFYSDYTLIDLKQDDYMLIDLWVRFFLELGGILQLRIASLWLEMAIAFRL
jgi:hypothetical protein